MKLCEVGWDEAFAAIDDDRAAGTGARKPGVNSNTLTGDTVIDPLPGTVQMAAIPMRITAA